MACHTETRSPAPLTAESAMRGLNLFQKNLAPNQEASFAKCSTPSTSAQGKAVDASLPLGESVKTLAGQPKLVPKHSATLHFDEAAHRYTLKEDGSECISVTTLLDKIFPTFDPDAVLAKYYENWQAPAHPRYQEYGGKSEEEIKAMWEDKGRESRDKGTEMHKQIELMFQGQASTLDQTVLSGLRHFLRQHSADLALGVLGVEVRMVSPSLRIAGTADLLAKRITGGLTLVDWKRTDKDITKDGFCFGEYCKAPIAPNHQIPANNFFKYALQLNLYKRLLEDNYHCNGGVVERMLVVQLHPNLPGGVKVVEIPDLSHLVDCILTWRENDLKQQHSPHGEGFAHASAQPQPTPDPGGLNASLSDHNDATGRDGLSVRGEGEGGGGGKEDDLAARLHVLCTVGGEPEEEHEEEWT
eukprot:CAMPEP_0181305078 /NCGR_PEP_ID=MMETSP1101-20121128/9524_1 /TAXON_ID=46948 /ORGANISM="Rhodomonas abbreviata, Strain Caron Lab Isolate" /LENGTH=413 /DNA_ID=CAMNT_0023410943 /DNA_START=57 /DNA_END=1298 /DNA_ORIENTATION=-